MVVVSCVKIGIMPDFCAQELFFLVVCAGRNNHKKRWQNLPPLVIRKGSEGVAQAHIGLVTVAYTGVAGDIRVDSPGLGWIETDTHSTDHGITPEVG